VQVLISDSSLVRAFNSAVLEPSKLATFLIINGFDGAALASFSESGVPDLAVGAILEYYAFEAGRYCTEQSKLVFRVMARIGVRAWMQDVVGYKKPTEEKIDFEAFLIKQLPYEAKKWEAKFKPEFWEALENLYGLKRGQQACGKFISHWIYKYFPQEVIERIAEINPLNEKGTRKNRIHQHFDDVLSKALDMQISMVTCNLIKSKSRHHFKRLMSSAKRYKFTFDSLKKLSGGENV
jgi:P63C domain